ncbi:MAG: hypothetical protein ACKOXA_05890, partial [Polynucleobacter sp.]
MTASDKVDYKKSGDVRGPNLALPPDLITAQADRRYVVQDGTATMSEYNQPSAITIALNLHSGDASQHIGAHLGGLLHCLV